MLPGFSTVGVGFWLIRWIIAAEFSSRRGFGDWRREILGAIAPSVLGFLERAIAGKQRRTGGTTLQNLPKKIARYAKLNCIGIQAGKLWFRAATLFQHWSFIAHLQGMLHNHAKLASLFFDWLLALSDY